MHWYEAIDSNNIIGGIATIGNPTVTTMTEAAATEESTSTPLTLP